MPPHLLAIFVTGDGDSDLLWNAQDDVRVIGVKTRDDGLGDLRDGLCVPDDVILPAIMN